MRNFTTSQGPRKPFAPLHENNPKPKTSLTSKHPRCFANSAHEDPSLFLKVQPQYPTFQSITPNTVYKMIITIQNQCTQTTKIKIIPPTTKYFRLCDYNNPVVSLAPGLISKIALEFKADEIMDYHDSFSLVTENYTKTIQLVASAPFPKIEYQSEINLNSIPINETTSFDIPFTNTGIEGKVVLNSQNKNISFIPQYLELKTDEKKVVSVKVKPKQQGDQFALIQILVNNKISQAVQILYTGIKHQQLVFDGEHQLQKVEFGKLFYGKKKTIKLRIVNNTNHKTQYFVIFKRATNVKRMSMKKLETIIEDKLFELTPNQKELLPFQSLDVELTLSPSIHQEHIDQVSKNTKRILTGSNMVTKMMTKMKMMEQEFEYSMMVKFSETSYISSIFCTLVLPNIKLSATEINFGDTTFGQKCQKILTIHNLGDLATEIELEKLPSINVQPKKLVLAGRDVKVFKITLLANTLGVVQKTQKITIAGLYNISIQLSGNILKNTSSEVLPKTASQRSNRHLSNLFRTTTKQNLLKLRNLSQTNRSNDLPSTLPTTPSVFNPKISLPQSKQGLFVVRPIDKYAPFKKTTRSLMVCKDRGKRTQVNNHRQLSQIQMQIPKQSLKDIECNYVEIDFGIMFMKSKETKKLQLINGLLTSIQIRLQTNNDSNKYLEFSHPRTIVSPEQKGSFEVTFKAVELGEIRTSLKYIINERHSFEILLFARVIPINLEVDKEVIKLTYGQNIKMDIEESLTLKNPGNSSSEFSITNTTYCTFSINQGVLKPKQQTEIKLLFKPLPTEVIQPGDREYKSKQQTNTYDEMALIKVKDGIDIPLKIMAQVVESRCSIKELEINFDKILINEVKTQTFTIKNSSKQNIAVYEIELGELEYCCSVDHPRGKIPPEGTKDIHVTFKIDKEIDLRSNLMVNFRGGTAISLPVIATTVVPYIEIQQPFLNFGTITIMSNSIIPITIANNSEFNVDLMIDLTEINVKDCLMVEFDEYWIGDERIQFYLKPDEKRSLRLKFQSTKVKYHTFEFPLYLPGKVKTKSMVRNIQCNVEKTRLMIEPTEIKFQKAIISDEIVPALEVFRIQNTQNRSIRWKLEEINSTTTTTTTRSFKPESECGWLNSNESTDVIMKFIPKKQGDIQSKFILKILDETNSMYSNELEVVVEGRAAHPKIIFDKREVIMPVVPLSIESRACLKIINEGYTNIELSYKLDADESLKSLINVVFPEGKKIIPGKLELPVYLTFVSKSPLSFSAKLEIFDNTGKCYPIIISGTAENSLLTCYPYLEQKLFYYTIYKKSTHQLMIQQFAEPEPLTKLNQFFLPEQSSYKNVNEAMLKWLKLTLCDEKLQKFPECLIETKGEPIFKLLNMITNQRETIKGLTKNTLQNYNSLLKYLKTHGCLLNHIRGYYLLNKQEYLAELESDPHIDLQKLHSEYTYWYKSNEAWIVLVFQIINVFKLDFFNTKAKFKGVEDRYSNIYSTQELGWIKWIETSLPQSQRQSVSITRLKDCFADGYVLASLIFQYLPNKSLLTKSLKPPPCKIEDIKHNFKQIKQMLKILNLYFFDGFNIQQFGDKEYIMFIRYLYSFLPSYIPKQQPLTFCCEVNEEITKTIDITNSSNKPVSYMIRIIGNQDFTCNESTIKIDGKKTYKLTIKYKCALWKQSKAYLMLTSKKEGLSISAPCVFELVNQIVKKTRTKKLDPITCTLYESTLVRIDLDKLTATRQVTQYNISLRQEDENENPVSGKYQAFSCDLEKVRIIKDIHSYIEVSYNPKSMRSSKCYISFSLEDKQTYTFELIGVPEMPKPVLFKPSHVLYVRKPETLEIPIPQPSPLATKQLSDLNQLKQESPLTVKTNLNHELLNYISIPYEVSPKQKLKIHIKSQHSIKDLLLDIILMNDSLTDIRRIKAIINVIPEMVIVEEMKTTAGVPVTKQIHINNTTEKDWKIQTKITNSQFSILNERQFTCKKGGGDHTIQVSFHPSWVAVTRAKLQIFNITTNELIEYQLIGVSDEPLCQRTIELKCKLRQLETFMIPIQSPFDALDYDVQIDLIGCHGHPTCSLTNQKVYYNLTVNPILTGVSNGSLTFYTKDRKYFWYKLIILTENSQTPNLLQVETTIGVPIELEIKIENKSNSPDYFSIELIGEQLYGQPKLEVKPKATSHYKLIYSPTHQNQSKGEVIFRSIISGEQSYQLDLKALKSTKPITLPQISCEIGYKKSSFIEIQNPLPEPTPVLASVNNKNFTIKYPDEVPPYSKAEIQIIYKPMVVQQQQCQITVNPKKLGKKIYLLNAKAMNLFKKRVIDFKCFPNKQDSKIIQFKQSHYDNLKVFLDDENDEAFQVKQVYEQNKIINILVVFKPQSLKQFATNLNITIGGKPAHVYALRGHVEIIMHKNDTLKIQGKCRVKTTKYIDVFIKQIETPQNDTFTFEIKNLPDYLNKVTNVKLMNNKPLKNNGLLRFEFKIEPQKQYDGAFQVHMYRDKGGLWIFKVELIIEPPACEAVIEISTKIKTLGMGHLSLGPFPPPPNTDLKYECNIIGVDKEYFEVSPSGGNLNINNNSNDDTKIKIEFEPTKLLKTNYTALLNIVSENYQKRYELRGIVPVYHPPKKVKRIEMD